MIRINLLTVERAAKKKPGGLHWAGQKVTMACGLILLLTLAFVGWRYWSLTKQSSNIDAELTAAEQEKIRINSIIQQVQQFDQRKAQLQQRVSLIEELRKGQSGPVHMLDQISRALPPMLWLTELKQNDKLPNEITIDGRCTSQTSVSDFVSNLEASGFFKKSIDIISSTTEPLPTPPGELVKFTIKAQFQPPAPPPVAKPAAARPGA
jgi:type IV pilus assembly protein PilN